METNIISAFQEQVKLRPDQDAIIDRSMGFDRKCSYVSLNEASSKGADFLMRLGVGKGDRVWVMQPMSIELYEILLSIFRLGAVALFIDPGYSKDQMRSCLEDGDPKVVIANWKAYLFMPKLMSVFKGEHAVAVGSFPFKLSWKREIGRSSMTATKSVKGEDPALLTFTSGSTGRPKGILRTHRFLAAQHQAIASTIGLQAGERDLATMPIFVLANLGSGLTSVIASGNIAKPGFVKVPAILKQIHKFKIDRISAAPAFLQRFLDHREVHPKSFERIRPRFEKIQKVYTGGGPVTVPFLQKLRILFPDAIIEAVYGSTEAEPIAILPVDAQLHCISGKGIPVGRVCDHIELRIIRDQSDSTIQECSVSEFEQMSCATGVPGEIVVSGAHVVQSYLDVSRNKETKFVVDGTVWHRTGDAGYFDDKGSLWLCGRGSAKVTVSGDFHYPFVVESLFHGDSSVARSALIGISDRCCLVIEPVGECRDTTGVVRRCKDLLKSIGLENLEIQIVRKIPVDRRHNSKVDYPRLKRLLQK